MKMIALELNDHWVHELDDDDLRGQVQKETSDEDKVADEIVAQKQRFSLYLHFVAEEAIFCQRNEMRRKRFCIRMISPFPKTVLR